MRKNLTHLGVISTMFLTLAGGNPISAVEEGEACSGSAFGIAAPCNHTVNCPHIACGDPNQVWGFQPNAIQVCVPLAPGQHSERICFNLEATNTCITMRRCLFDVANPVVSSGCHLTFLCADPIEGQEVLNCYNRIGWHPTDAIVWSTVAKQGCLIP